MQIPNVSRTIFSLGARAALLGGVAVVALLGLSQPASALECLLDTNGDGNADTNVDTVAGADDNGFSDSLACGSGARTFEDDQIAIGEDAATGSGGTGSIAIGADGDEDGFGAFTTGANSVAIGVDAQAGFLGVVVHNATAVGGNSIAGASGSSAFGANASATGVGATAIGFNSSAAGADSVAMGENSSAGGQESVAIGSDANAAGTESVAIGDNASAGGFQGIAMGVNSNAAGSESIAIGEGAQATNTEALALGDDAIASGVESIAIGDNAIASGNQSTALGNNAEASFFNSTALGNGAVATAANQMMFGTAANTYTMPGITSAASLAAQSGPLEVVTSDAFGNLATDGGSIFSALSSHGKQIRDNTEGVALALALQTPWVPPTQQMAVSGGFGAFEGEYALALGAAFRIDPSIQIEGGIGVGIGHTNVGGRVGVTLSW